MLIVDGSFGEGGGQILRSALTLSLVTGSPFRMVNVRSRRKRPGLRRQHLTALRAAAAVGSATVTGDEVGSRELSFSPRAVKSGDYSFAIGTAGSTTLVLQTVLPALALADGSSRVVLEGGTHNPQAPSFDFLERAYLPLLERMGPKVRVELDRPGFYPAGGGRFTVAVVPTASLHALELLDRGPILERRVTARVSQLPRHIADRELETLSSKLRWDASCFRVEELDNVSGPGNVLVVELIAQHATEVFTGVGVKGVPAETIASRLGNEVKEYLRAGVPVGRHLADQLVLLLAIAGAGRFATLSPSSHLTTQLEVIRLFLGIHVRLHAQKDGTWVVEV